MAAGVDAAWGAEAHLLASVIDVLRMANWQRGGDEKAARPDPVLRPSGLAEKAAAEDRMLARAFAFRERQKRRAAERAAATTTEEA